MPKKIADIHYRFMVACAVAKTTLCGFAAEAGVTSTAIQRVLRGQSTSDNLQRKILTFINTVTVNANLKGSLISDFPSRSQTAQGGGSRKRRTLNPGREHPALPSRKDGV